MSISTIKLKKLFAISLACLFFSFNSVANFLKLEYSGTVKSTGGSGFGYSVNDSISGWFSFDLAEIICSARTCAENNLNSMESNFVSDIYQFPYNLVRISENSTFDNISMNVGSDANFYRDSNYPGFQDIVQQVIIHDFYVTLRNPSVFDWNALLANGYASFDMSALDADGNFFMRDYELVDDDYNGGSYFTYNNRLGGEITRFSIEIIESQTTNTVPEPSAIGLLVLGVFGIGVFKRQRLSTCLIPVLKKFPLRSSI